MRMRLGAALADAALALVASACGGASGVGSDGPLKIGAVLSLTGAYAPSAEYVEEGYKLWAKEVNADGGIGGRKVQLVFRDDQSDPATAGTLARSLVERDGVEFVLGPYGSDSTDTMAATLESLQVPMLGTIASDSAIWNRRELNWTFQAFPSSTYDHKAFLAVAEAKGINRITIVYEDSGFSVAAADWAEKQARTMGMTVQMLEYPADSTDFSSIVTKAKSFGPQALTMGGYYEPSILLTKEMQAQDLTVDLYHFIQSSDGVTEEALGKNVEGILGRSSWEPQLHTPGNEHFVSAYQKMFGREPSYHSAAAYAAGEVAEKALTAGEGDPEAVRQFLASQTVGTVGGTYKVNEKGQQVGFKYVGTQWQNGQKEIIWPDGPATAEAEMMPSQGWS